ncbi:MAG: ABC transporter permease [Anaerolineales bacterium]|nr:ABC transporter permease [Anaerolineales bacterium]
MKAFSNHFAFEFKTALRNSTQMLMNYLFPLVFYVMMGLIMTSINPGFKDILIPAMIVFIFMVSALLGMPGPMVESREAGIYRSFKINGVPALSILAIPVLTTLFHSFIVAAIIALTATPLFGGSAPTSWLNLILVSLLGAFALGGLGALIGVVSTGARSTVLWAQAVFLPSMLLGGLMMPLEFIPESMLPFSALLPPTHLMQAFLGFAYETATTFDLSVSIAALLAGGFLSAGLALYLFDWDSQNQARRGHPLLGLLALSPYLIASLFLFLR